MKFKPEVNDEGIIKWELYKDDFDYYKGMKYGYKNKKAERKWKSVDEDIIHKSRLALITKCLDNLEHDKG